MKSPGGILNMLEAAQPAGDMFDPAVPDLALYQDLRGGTRIAGNLGWGNFNKTLARGNFVVAAPNFAHHTTADANHQIRNLSFPLLHWKKVLDEAAEGRFSFDDLDLRGGPIDSPVISSALQKLWSVSHEEGAPSRLLAQAAGCEILAELCRLGGEPFAPPRGGLAPWAQRRSLELMRARLSEDISLEELAAEARLSPFHFARMFKQSLERFTLTLTLGTRPDSVLYGNVIQDAGWEEASIWRDLYRMIFVSVSLRRFWAARAVCRPRCGSEFRLRQ